ncbi:hypothetical protein M9979_10970 [Sphingomonas sp. RP10(2022)]|uniref:Uncharacterized protein n=1 Tax=Sphingomonas liriopis TaxID=2949094 RepID=A0A9X2HQ47_9SPHN|nr:hypothetical protein [Sphingomonas liriopis]MCP3735391.1 hypothetical protein [Sphingomonas liriopis]
MIDMPEVPPAYEQVLTQKLIHCGLHHGGFTVKYERELQSVEIVIGQDAGAATKHFDCIREAAGHEIVTFENPELHQAYEDRVFKALRPKILADARAELERRGVLHSFPERSKFASDKLFAEALERQCGMKPGSFFVESQSGLIGQPKPGRQSKADEERTACLMAAIMYVSAKGEPFKFGFVGNEAIPSER